MMVDKDEEGKESDEEIDDDGGLFIGSRIRM